MLPKTITTALENPEAILENINTTLIIPTWLRAKAPTLTNDMVFVIKLKTISKS